MKKFLLSVICFVSIMYCNVFAGEQSFDQLKDNNKLYKNISLKIGSNILNIDGTENIMDSPAEISKDRIFIPLRNLYHAFEIPDENIIWDSIEQTVKIN